MLSRSLLLGVLLSSASTLAWGQAAPPEAEAPQGVAPAVGEELPPEEELEDEDPYEVEAVVVTAGRERGAVIGDIPPEIQLNAREIRALGAGDLAELLEILAPQIRSGSGRENGPPVTLLNGRRISGFSEIRSLPPEAIERIDILPEEVALKYGYRADQRVVNIVLRERFRAVTAEVAGGVATAGGRGQTGVDLNLLRINRDRRWSFEVEHDRSAALSESERDIVASSSGAPYDLLGNVGALAPGGEIDPALSALVGVPVTVAGVPLVAAARAPTLGEFSPGAGAPNVTDLSSYRTLLPQTEALSLNGTLSRPMIGEIPVTLNARLDLTANDSLLGLPSAQLTLPADNPYSPFGSDVLVYRYADASGALRRESDSRTFHLGLASNGQREDWRWSVTANYDHVNSVTRTDRNLDTESLQARLDAGDAAFNPFAPLPLAALDSRRQDRAESTTQTASAELVINGDLFELPAGALSTTVRTQLEARSFERETLRAGVADRGDLSRQRGSVQANFDLPITSRRREVLSGLGDLTANLNVERDRLSDFGALTTVGAGLNWSPVERLTLLGSFTQEDGAPSVQQLGDPVIATPLVQVFDFTRGETVEVTRLEGGNPDLIADTRRVIRLGLNLQPYQERDLRLSLNYNRSTIEDPISSFPAITAEIEAAFPERFQRDESGRLLQFDSRPVNFARSEREEVRWGVNYSRPLRPSGAAARARMGPAGAADGRPAGGGTPPSAANAEVPAAQEGRGAGARRREGRGPDGAGGGFPRGGGRGFGGRGGREGRLQLALYHTIRLQDSILIRDGLPELDLLDGAALGPNGGRSRHELELQAGVFRSGLGARVEGQWRSETFVRGGAGGAGTDEDLFFSPTSSLNLRLFADLGQQRSLVRRYEWLRGARVSLAINNLFDTRPEVRDESGLTPVTYQPDRLDPLGRSVRISVRKLFLGRRGQAWRRGAEGGAR